MELEVSTGTLGGLITTVEGLVDTIITSLKATQVHCAQILPT
jgi:C4-type Zn-finger protein